MIGVNGVWAGVDSVREQKKLEARKMLENAAESHTSSARFVGGAWVMRIHIIGRQCKKAETRVSHLISITYCISQRKFASHKYPVTPT